MAKTDRVRSKEHTVLGTILWGSGFATRSVKVKSVNIDPMHVLMTDMGSYDVLLPFRSVSSHAKILTRDPPHPGTAL
jgi:hypothetical protein